MNRDGEVTPSVVRDALQAAGFVLASKGRGYTRWQWPGDTRRDPSLMVPDEADTPEYAELMASLTEGLRDAYDRGSRAGLALAIIACSRPSPDAAGGRR